MREFEFEMTVDNITPPIAEAMYNQERVEIDTEEEEPYRLTLENLTAN